MDVLELLGRLGEVEPADQTVLDSAMRSLVNAAELDDRRHRSSGRAQRRHRRLTSAAVGAIVLSAAAAIVLANALTASGPARKTARHAAAHALSKAPSVRAILTALRTYGGDVLRVTKTMKGDYGTLGKTVIWLSPVAPAQGTPVRARVLTYSLSGARQTDMAVSYTASRPTARPTGAACAIVFHRPRAALLPARGLPGTLTYVDYREHIWGEAAVAVAAGTAPSIATLRACVRARQWQVSGRGTLDGTTVVKLVMAPGYLRLWVSAATFLPVRLISAGPDVETITYSFSFLAPTAANKALLTPPIPAGFSKRQL